MRHYTRPSKPQLITAIYSTAFLSLESISTNNGRTEERNDDVQAFLKAVICPMSTIQLQDILMKIEQGGPDLKIMYYDFISKRIKEDQQEHQAKILLQR